jgi:hypothetical protein
MSYPQDDEKRVTFIWNEDEQRGYYVPVLEEREHLGDVVEAFSSLFNAISDAFIPLLDLLLEVLDSIGIR